MTDPAHLKHDILAQVGDYHALVHTPAPFVPGQTLIKPSGVVYGSEEMEALASVALDFWLTAGPWTDTMERAITAAVGCRHVTLTASGSTANLAALMTLLATKDLKPGDEVLTPAVTFPTTVAPIVQLGLVPVFVDAQVGSYTVNPALLEQAIGPRTRAMLIPHTLGIPADLDVITDLCERRDLILVEDACDALGGRWRNAALGSYGELATLSFFTAHQVAAGEGGALLVNRAYLIRPADSVASWGRHCWCAPGQTNTCGKRYGWTFEGCELPDGYDHKNIYTALGSNFKPTEMQAAVGVAQMARLSAFVAARRRNFWHLYTRLADCTDRLILPVVDTRSTPAWFGFPITCRSPRARDALVRHLETAKIESRHIFAGNLLRQPGYRDIPHRLGSSLWESDRIMRDSFFVGVWPGLGEAEMDYIGETIRAWCRG